jgi:hypothetical protein
MKGIYITLYKYLKEIFNKFGMDESKPIGTPIVTRVKLSKEGTTCEVNQTLYRYMIGKL